MQPTVTFGQNGNIISVREPVRGHLQEYRTQRWVPIHYPPGGLDDSLRRSVVGDIPGLRLPKRVILSKGTTSPPGSLKTSAARLTICLANKVRAACTTLRSVANVLSAW